MDIRGLHYSWQGGDPQTGPQGGNETKDPGTFLVGARESDQAWEAKRNPKRKSTKLSLGFWLSSLNASSSSVGGLHHVPFP